jgi:hypothetical protein
LINQLKAKKAKGKIHFKWRYDSDGHITMLFITDTRSVKYLNKHPNVLLLDYTYKTNKFDILLLNILSINYYNNSFTIALCFLDHKITKNYKEAV